MILPTKEYYYSKNQKKKALRQEQTKKTKLHYLFP